MNKVSKILVMAIVILAVITMSLNVNASTEKLKAYVGDIHNINNMVFELTDSQKTVVLNYISTLDDATAESIYQDILKVESLVGSTGATNVKNISKSVKSEIIGIATSAAAKAGLALTVNTSNNTFTLTKNVDGNVLISGSADALTSYVTAGSSSAASGSQTLLYTGANYAVYAVAVLAIVAVAIVVKKRA